MKSSLNLLSVYDNFWCNDFIDHTMAAARLRQLHYKRHRKLTFLYTEVKRGSQQFSAC